MSIFSIGRKSKDVVAPVVDTSAKQIADLQNQVNELLAMLAQQQQASTPVAPVVAPATKGDSFLTSIQAPVVEKQDLTAGMSELENEIFTSAQKSLYSRSVDISDMDAVQVVQTALAAGWPTKNAKLSPQARQAIAKMQGKPLVLLASKPKKSKGKSKAPAKRKESYSLVNGLWVNDGIGEAELEKAIKDAQNGDYVSNALQHAITAHIATAPVELDNGEETKLASLLQGKTDKQRQAIGEQFTQENWGVERSKVTCGCLYGGKNGCRTHQNLTLQQSGDTSHLLAWAKTNNVPTTWTNAKGKEVKLRDATILKRARKAGYDQYFAYAHNNPYK